MIHVFLNNPQPSKPIAQSTGAFLQSTQLILALRILPQLIVFIEVLIMSFKASSTRCQKMCVFRCFIELSLSLSLCVTRELNDAVTVKPCNILVLLLKFNARSIIKKRFTFISPFIFTRYFPLEDQGSPVRLRHTKGFS